MNDYSPDKLSAKWAGKANGTLEVLRKNWERGRPRKHIFSFGLPETDSRLDQMTPAEASRILFYEGHVVMGHVARAFFPAYIHGKGTHYGSVVYSTDSIPVDSLFAFA